MTDYLTALVGAGGAAFGALVTWFALGKRIQADERLAEKKDLNSTRRLPNGSLR